MELSAAMAADLATLTEALDGPDPDLAQTVQQLVCAAKGAVGSYLGLSIIATTGGRQINLAALEDAVEAEDILTSLRVPLDVADTHHPNTHRADSNAQTGHAEAITGPRIELILYAGNPGGLIDLAADLSWLSGRDLRDFVLDAHLIVAEHSDELGRTSWVNQAIGVLIGCGYTPEHAAQEIGTLAARTEQDRRRSADYVFTRLGVPDPQST